MTNWKTFKARSMVCSWLLVVCLANTVGGQQPTKTRFPFSTGEELVYQTEFNRSLLRGVDVAEFHFRVTGEPDRSQTGAAQDRTSMRIIGDVVSRGFFTRLFRVSFHEHIESTIGVEAFSPLRTVRSDEQGKRIRINEAVFDHQAHKVTWTERDPNGSRPATSTTIDFQEPVQDILSAIYFLRTQKLVVGQSFSVPLTDAGRFVIISVKVVERKKMKSALGNVNALRLEPAMFGEGGLVRRRGTFSIWITDDSRRIPISAQLKVDVGTFDIKLKRVIDGTLNQIR